MPNHWVFSNKPADTYKNAWDMSHALRENEYYIWETERNRQNIQVGDIVVMRVYGGAFIGKFKLAGEWTRNTSLEDGTGFFPMENVERWRPELPQSLIMIDLSNKQWRNRIISIKTEDLVKIETAQKIYERLKYGSGDGTFFLLERGLEEAVKQNLEQIGLQLAEDNIAEQCVMGNEAGRSDLICKDKDDNYVVVELKRDASDIAVGQICRYMGWIKETLLNEGQSVSGIIIACSYDEQLRLAAAGAGIKVMVARF